MRFFKLEMGFNSKLTLRHEHLTMPQATGEPLKILYLSDLHYWGPVGPIAAKNTMIACMDERPDLVLLGGDLVDGTQGLRDLSGLVKGLSCLAPVWAVGGNHDFHFGLRQVKEAVTRGGGNWLGSRSVALQLRGNHLRLDGRRRADPLDGSYRIYCTHEPESFPAAAAQNYDLMLAGHLHGCQFVFWQKNSELFPGRWFFKWNGLRYRKGRTRMLVSRGAGDLIPLRWNCPREAICVNLSPTALEN
ncbi:MAG: metallophosphoesterase [candidate division FCPU426 bacterium]